MNQMFLFNYVKYLQIARYTNSAWRSLESKQQEQTSSIIISLTPELLTFPFLWSHKAQKKNWLNIYLNKFARTKKKLTIK